MSIILEALQDGLDELGLPGAHVGNDNDSVYAIMIIYHNYVYRYGEFWVRATVSDRQGSITISSVFKNHTHSLATDPIGKMEHGSVSLYDDSLLEEIHKRFAAAIDEFRTWLEVTIERLA